MSDSDEPRTRLNAPKSDSVETDAISGINCDQKHTQEVHDVLNSCKQATTVDSTLSKPKSVCRSSSDVIVSSAGRHLATCLNRTQSHSYIPEEYYWDLEAEFTGRAGIGATVEKTDDESIEATFLGSLSPSKPPKTRNALSNMKAHMLIHFHQ